MDRVLLLILLLTGACAFGQEVEVEQIFHNGKEYWLYPERQMINHNPAALIWKKEVRLSRKELKEYKWRDRRFFRKKLRATTFPIDGDWLQFFDSEDLRIAKEFSVANGLPNGSFKRYNEYGDLIEEGMYRDGNRYGEFFFYPDSSRYSPEYATGNYAMVDSAYYRLAFFPYYHIIEEGKQGTWEYRREDSSLYLIETYEHGTLHGKSIGYYADGSLTHDFHYENGELHGIQRRWYKNGQPRDEVTFDMGIREGTLNSWYADGKQKCSLTYQDDKIIDGLCTQYYEDGAKSGEGYLEDDTRLGAWTFWHENGEIKAQGTFKEYVTEVCISGMSRPYLHSVAVGEWRFWHPDGQVLAHGEYSNVKELIPRGAIWSSEMVEGTWTCHDAAGNTVACEEVRELLEVEY